jgi:hypothetical protein
MTRRSDIYAIIPPRLARADDALHRYGQWARDRPKRGSCGSVERNFLRERYDDEADRQPKLILMHPDEAQAVQKALYKVPERERKVLAILYVPKIMPAHVQLRIARIPARLSQERHIAGLNMFDNRMNWVYSRSPGAAPASQLLFGQAAASEQEETPSPQEALA